MTKQKSVKLLIFRLRILIEEQEKTYDKLIEENEKFAAVHLLNSINRRRAALNELVSLTKEERENFKFDYFLKKHKITLQR